MERPILFKNGHLICPEQKIEANGWLYCDRGVIQQTGTDDLPTIPENAQIIDCKGKILAPGLIDMRVSSGDPGAEHLETLTSLKEAAAKGGVTSFVILPATIPVIDTAALIDSVQLRASRLNGPNLYCYGAITKDLEPDQMAELGMMAQAGAVGFASGVLSVQDAQTMRRIMTYARMFNRPVIHHCENTSLTHDADMNEGETSTRLGLLGQPAQAESIIVQRDIALCQLTGAHFHASHISTAGAVKAIRQAKKEGLKVTADTAPPYFLLNELSVSGYDTACKLNPPLRSEEDRLAIIEGLADGTIDAIASDHIPVNLDMKAQPFSLAQTGASGIELLLALTAKLVKSGHISWLRAFECLSAAPARILSLSGGSLKSGMPADLICIDPVASWRIEGRDFKSLSRITPFEGHPAEGIVTDMWIAGQKYEGVN